ncbi:hypothetical protein PMAYCL1PPCAC_28979, partial [Pristionchus mayeri]
AVMNEETSRKSFANQLCEAASRIGFSLPSMNQAIRRSVHSENIDIKEWESAIREVSFMLEKDLFSRFKRSSIYHQFISWIVNAPRERMKNAL